MWEWGNAFAGRALIGRALDAEGHGVDRWGVEESSQLEMSYGTVAEARQAEIIAKSADGQDGGLTSEQIRDIKAILER